MLARPRQHAAAAQNAKPEMNIKSRTGASPIAGCCGSLSWGYSAAACCWHQQQQSVYPLRLDTETRQQRVRGCERQKRWSAAERANCRPTPARLNDNSRTLKQTSALPLIVARRRRSACSSRRMAHSFVSPNRQQVARHSMVRPAPHLSTQSDLQLRQTCNVAIPSLPGLSNQSSMLSCT